MWESNLLCTYKSKQAPHFSKPEPAAEPQLIEEADRRFGWKERNSRKYLAKLKELPGIESKQQAVNRPKSFESTL